MKGSCRRKLSAVLLAGALTSAACAVVSLQDVSVAWTIEGVEDPADCARYGIAYFTVDVLGPDRDGATIACSDYWEVLFFDLEEGVYDFTVAAWDANDQRIGARTSSTFVDGGAPSPLLVDIDLRATDLTGVAASCGDGVCEGSESCATCPADCPCGDARIDVMWNINGTRDGTDRGQSWDTCAEVGATEAVVSIDGVEQRTSCSAGGNMSTTLGGLTNGKSYTVTIKLVDGAGTDLTTQVSAAVTASVEGTLFIGDFYYDAFYEPKRSEIEGQYHFSTSYEQKSCSETTPPVDVQLTLIRTEDDAVVQSVQVCDRGNTGCHDADAADPRPCTDLEQVLSLLPWGMYKIALDGAMDTGGSPEICWGYAGTILIGAGTDNPLEQLDLAPINGASCFQ